MTFRAVVAPTFLKVGNGSMAAFTRWINSILPAATVAVRRIIEMALFGALFFRFSRGPIRRIIIGRIKERWNVFRGWLNMVQFSETPPTHLRTANVLH